MVRAPATLRGPAHLTLDKFEFAEAHALTQMGFHGEQVRAALHRAAGNVDAAIAIMAAENATPPGGAADGDAMLAFADDARAAGRGRKSSIRSERV